MTYFTPSHLCPLHSVVSRSQALSLSLSLSLSLFRSLARSLALSLFLSLIAVKLYLSSCQRSITRHPSLCSLSFIVGALIVFLFHSPPHQDRLDGRRQRPASITGWRRHIITLESNAMHGTHWESEGVIGLPSRTIRTWWWIERLGKQNWRL